MAVLLAVFSEEGQKKVAAGTSVLSYNKEVHINAGDSLKFHQENAYSNVFGVHGSEAASSLINTLRIANEDQIAIGYSSVSSSSIYKGDYTLQQIKWVVTAKCDVYRGQYTGAQLRQNM